MVTDSETRRLGPVLPVRQTRTQTRRFYDRLAPIYDLLSERAESVVRRRALRLLGARPGEHMLEIGFGTGHGLVELARAVGAGGRVFGIDLSKAMLTRARNLIQESALETRVTLRQGDAIELPYADRTMNGVLMTFTLELFDTPEIPIVLSECRRVLRPGGRIVVAGLTRETDAGAIVRVLEWTHAHMPWIFDCRPIYVRRALADARFTIAAVQTLRAWVPVEIVRGQVPPSRRPT